MANAAARGEQLKQGLRQLERRHPETISDVRGLGLMVAMDIMSGGLPDPRLREQLVNTAFERGLLLLGCGECAVRFCPPLCITAEQIDTALKILEQVLSQSPVAASATSSAAPVPVGK
jgi:4-aminobutyrate aminotransferase